MSIVQEKFGTFPCCGSDVTAYTLTNAAGMRVKILDMGGTLVEIQVPDAQGQLRDVICGYDCVEGYATSGGYQGALIGRIGNRIKGGKFTLDGADYQLYQNDGNNHLHGGRYGFDKKKWNANAYEQDGNAYLVLTYTSPDGEENYPGTLQVKVTYTLTADNGLSIHYEATTDKTTIVNLTNHSYFNLAGYEHGNVGEHELWLDSNFVTMTDDELIPIGKNLPVAGTPFDFTVSKLIGRDIDADDEMLRQGGGYDHNFFLNADSTIKLSAKLYHPASKISMKMYTDQPCVQVYTANMINPADHPFKNNIPQTKRCGVCLETQHMPDSINCPGFTDVILHPNETYDYTTTFIFGIE